MTNPVMAPARLPTRPLGRKGPEISVVGFGAWAIGGGGWSFGWGPQKDDPAIAAMRHALERGVNWIDTAAVYGLGHSEELIGRLLQDIPSNERPYVFTKCGLRWNPSDRYAPPLRTLRPESIRQECEDSLRRLHVDHIDLYQFHWPDEEGIPIEDSWQAMSRLMDEGKVRWGGVSNFDMELLERCERIRHVDSLQPPLSLIHREAAHDLIPWCRNHGTGVIVYSPMQSGLLTERWSLERVHSLAQDDWRRHWPDFQEPDIEKNLALRDALKPIAARHHASTGAIAVAWTLAWSGLTGAIVGARSPEQVDGWISAATIELDSQDLREIAQAIRETGAGEGPAMPS